MSFRPHCGVSGRPAAGQRNHGGWQLSEGWQYCPRDSQHVDTCLGTLEMALYRDMMVDAISELGVCSQLTPVSWSAKGGLAILVTGLGHLPL